MWVKQCHKPPVWEWFIPSIYVDLGDGLWHCFTHIILENCNLKKTPRFFGLMQNNLSRKGNNTCTTEFFKLTFFLLIPSRLRVALTKKRAFPLPCSLGTASMSGTYSTRRRFHEPSMSGFPSLWIGPGTSYGKNKHVFPLLPVTISSFGSLFND